MVPLFVILLVAINQSYEKDTVTIILQNRVKHKNKIFIVKPGIGKSVRMWERPMVLNLPVAPKRIREKKKLSLDFGRKKKMAFVYADDHRTLRYLENRGYEVYVYRTPDDTKSDIIQLSARYQLRFYNGIPSLIKILGIRYLPALVEVKGDEAFIVYGYPN